MDILGSLLPEITELILQYLSPKELSACSQVCKAWRDISSKNRVWRHHCSELDLLEYVPSGDGSGTSCKQVYSEFVLSWKSGACTQFSLAREPGALHSCIYVQGDLLVMYWCYDVAHLYRLHPCGPQQIGHIDRFSHNSEFGLRTFNESYIVMEAEIGVKVYEATKSSCCFHSGYLLRDGNLRVYTKREESEFNDNLSQGYFSYIYLDGTYIYFQLREGFRIYAVNLETLWHTSREELANFRLLDDPYITPSNNGNVFLFNEVTKDIGVLDRSLSEEIMLLHTDPAVVYDSFLKTSDSYVVGLFWLDGCEQFVKVWNKFDGNEVLCKRFQITVHVDDVLISRDQVFILVHNFPTDSKGHQFNLSCFSITSGKNLWEQDLPRRDTLFPIASYSVYFRCLYFIKPQFLAVTGGQQDRRFVFVFDPVSGKELYHQEFQSSLPPVFERRNWLSSKCIVNTSYDKFQICSFIPNKFEQEIGQLVGGEGD